MAMMDWLTLRGLPDACFISHAYKDAEMGVIEQLRQRLPRRVQPFIFPPINVSPDQRVSDDLVAAILSQQGLIHVVGPNSSSSVWVNFERDYALRAGRAVFSYDAGGRALRRDRSRPSALRVFPAFNRRDRGRIEEIAAFMRDRHFSVWDEMESLQPGMSWRDTIREDIEATMRNGGYLVTFLSQATLDAPQERLELTYARKMAPERILPVLLDKAAEGLTGDAVLGRNPVRLYRADDEGTDWNRVDDLMVRIYHMVHSELRAT